jgi:hypothetical protein
LRRAASASTPMINVTRDLMANLARRSAPRRAPALAPGPGRAPEVPRVLSSLAGDVYAAPVSFVRIRRAPSAHARARAPPAISRGS